MNTSGSITLEDIMRSIDELKEKTPNSRDSIQYGMFNQFNLGKPVFEVEPDIRPVIEFRGFAYCSDEFKAKQQAWLTEMFGTKDYTTLMKGNCYMMPYGIVMRKDDIGVLRGASLIGA